MKKIALMLFVALFVTACGNDDVKQLPAQSVAPQYQQQAPVAAAPTQPVIVQQTAPAQSGASTGEMLMAGAAGYMLSNVLNGSSQNRESQQMAPTTVVNKTYVTKNYVSEAPKPVTPALVAAPVKSAPSSYVAPATKSTTSYSASKPMSYSGSSSFASSSRSFSSSSSSRRR